MATSSSFLPDQELVIDAKFRRKLEKELKTSIVDESTRQRVEAMKKRAIITSRSYDEFRHLVACASDGLTHMKGTELQDGLQFKATIDERGGYNSSILKENSGAIGAKHSAATRRAASSRAALAAGRASVDAAAAARDPHSFAREWRRASEHGEGDARRGELRCEILRGMKTKRLKRLFNADIDSQLLGEILETLRDALRLGAAWVDVPAEAAKAEAEPELAPASLPSPLPPTPLPPTPPPSAETPLPPVQMTAKRGLRIVDALASSERCHLSAEFLSDEQRGAAAALIRFGAGRSLVAPERVAELESIFAVASLKE